MRRSTAVKLTLLPMLATAAVAAAEPPLPPADPAPDDTEASPPADAAPDDLQVSAPGATQPLPAPADPSEQLGLAPPGMTPTLQELDCDSDPNWRLRDDCFDDDDVYVSGGVIRGGFGSYFWSGGGRGGHGGHGG